MNRPLISIVMPVYNVAKYLSQSVESVLYQDYDNFELILVDDGSSDECPQICDEIARKSSKVSVVHKANGGLGFARNTGIENAKGEYIYFLDSDDTIQKDTLSQFINIINKEGELSLIGTEFQIVNENERHKETHGDGGYEVFISKTELQRKFLLRDIIILAPGTLYNLKWLKENNLKFKKVPYSEDQLFVWEVLLNIEKGAFIHLSLYNYLQRQGSIMVSTKFAKIREAYPYFKVLSKSINVSAQADETVKKFMLARWCFGIFHSGAKLCSKSEYKQLLKDFEAPIHLKTIQRFPDFKIRLLSVFYYLGVSFFYWVNRII